VICEEAGKKKKEKLTVLICLAFSGAPTIVLLRHARIANIARVFEERTSVPVGRSLSKYNISSRSTSPMNQAPHGKSISGNNLFDGRGKNELSVLTLHVKLCILANWLR
jgi:hypothetical protein